MNLRPSGYEPDELPDCSTPRYYVVYDMFSFSKIFLKKKMDGGGFEPPKQFAADLQSVPFGHSGIHPYGIVFHKADDRTRTDNLLITNQLLCQLSHIGECLTANGWRWIRTTEAICSRFTVCPLWPLGNPSIFFLFDGTNRARTYDPLLVRQMLSQLSYDPICSSVLQPTSLLYNYLLLNVNYFFHFFVLFLPFFIRYH